MDLLRAIRALPVRLLALALAFLCVATAARAAPSLRVRVQQRGDFVIVGNTLAHDCAAGTPAPIVGTVGDCGFNGIADPAADVFWRSSSPASGQAEANIGITVAQARSRALLDLPSGAVVTHAFLYWAARSPPGSPPDTTVTLDAPGATSIAVTSAVSYALPGGSYQSVADVTPLVQSVGSGVYQVSGVDGMDLVNLNVSVAFAGWWLVVLYQLDGSALQDIALFDGLDEVSNGFNQDVMLSGLLVPAAGFTGRLGVVAFEGDDTITGDFLSFDGVQLSNATNPVNNFFNSTRTSFGSPFSVPGDLPQLAGTPGSLSGMDIDVVDVTPFLSPDQTSVPITASSSGDTYYLAGFVTAISSFAPELRTSTKTAVDLNGGDSLPGDVVEYTITVNNTGNDASNGTELTDPLPAGLSYVPGSLMIIQGANAGPKTDALGDDQGEYDAALRLVRVRLGIGADATAGGSLAIGASTTVTFQATLDPDAFGLISNQAIITAGGLLGAPWSDTPTDAELVAPGSQPTEILVSQCSGDAHCAAPTSVCKLVA